MAEPVTTHPNPLEIRNPRLPVQSTFVTRWSPRSFASKPVLREHLESMVEAARWAPSSMNAQPWQFHIANGPGPVRDAWNEAVNSFNRAWGDKAPVLVWVVARTHFEPSPRRPEPTPNPHAEFDVGAAAMQFVLQGEHLGLKAHYLGGVDVVKAHQILGLGAEFKVVCGLYVGYPDSPAHLPDGLREREVPSQRKSFTDVAVFH